LTADSNLAFHVMLWVFVEVTNVKRRILLRALASTGIPLLRWVAGGNKV